LKHLILIILVKTRLLLGMATAIQDQHIVWIRKFMTNAGAFKKLTHQLFEKVRWTNGLTQTSKDWQKKLKLIKLRKNSLRILFKFTSSWKPSYKRYFKRFFLNLFAKGHSNNTWHSGGRGSVTWTFFACLSSISIILAEKKSCLRIRLGFERHFLS